MAFIGIDRAIEHHWIYQDPEYFKVWFEILIRARFGKETERKLIEGELVTIEYGYFVFGRIKWSERLKVSERRIRTLFDKLLKDGMIELVMKHRKCTVYKVINYAKYHVKSDQQNDQQPDQPQQVNIGFYDQQNDQPATSERPAGDQRATTQEQSKQRNKVNKVNNKRIYAEQVSLSEDEYLKLVEKYGNEDSVKWAIEKLSNYKCSKATKYKSDYHVLIGWVYDDFEKKKLTVVHGGQSQYKKISSFEKLQQMAREEQEREASGHY